ncbi:MAG: endo-1,4-beta-xylanase, partial [Planctomycetota bacterium]
MIDFCQSHKIGIRGHYLSWAPLSRDTYKPTDYRKHPDKLWPELSAHIDEMLFFTKGRLAEWDAVNHIVGWNGTISTVTGSNEIYAKIIRHARSKTKTPLWVNEGSILPGGNRIEGYEKIIRYLFENNAAPDGIGFMAHFRAGAEGPPRPIEEIWNIYNRFARFGVPLQLTEFDIDTRDEQLQADYLRDVMTITFSHPSFNAIIMW